MKALGDHPEQRAALAADFDALGKSAIDEIIRHATPVMTFRRTATRDVELNGQQINEGDWVVTLFSSANRDERAFESPERFDIHRARNPHVSFGGGGPHYCMGQQLAKTQLHALLGELLRRAPRLELGEPDYLVGNFVHAVKAMPYQL
jgi:cytochrome P450